MISGSFGLYCLQIRGADNVPVVYLWGYCNKYPIAEIRNATYTEVCKKIGNGNETTGKNILESVAAKELPGDDGNFGLIDNLRISLPNAFVTTYTYNPLVGISSVTDPSGKTVSYKYDDFNRLEYTKDSQGGIIERYDYHFKK